MIKFHFAFIFLLGAVLLGSCDEDNQSESRRLFDKLDVYDTKVNFQNKLLHSEEFNIMRYSYYYNGAGVAVGDINADGLQDILFTGNMVDNRLYLNKGNFEFQDVTKRAGIAENRGWSTGASFVDINNDGFLDIYICRSGYPKKALRKNLLFINNGDLTFTEKAAEYGLGDPGYSTQSVFFDFDKDGDLDMFLANQSSPEFSVHNLEIVSLRQKKMFELGNKLYENVEGKFRDITEGSGIESNALTFSLGLSVGDVNNDGWMDVFVGNDFNEPDYLYINNQNGTFTDMTKDYFDHTSMFSMGSDMADFNNDGLLDIVSLDMQSESNYLQKMHSGFENFDKIEILQKNGFFKQYSRNMLQLNNGDGTFSEIGQFAGISNTEWSWSPLLADFDNDGYKDLFVSNGYARDNTNMDFVKFSTDISSLVNSGKEVDMNTFAEYVSEMPKDYSFNYIFQNTNGLDFENKSVEWGIGDSTVTQGAAYADLDNDGDLDLILNNTEGYADIYRNNSETFTGNNYVKISLKGDRENPTGIGSEVLIYANGKMQHQQQTPIRGYQSAVDQNLNFGLGKSEVVDSVIVKWPKGTTQKIENLKVNQAVVVNYQDAQSHVSEKVITQTYFDKDSLFAYKHTENKFNDFKQQSLIPHAISKLGPCIVKSDVNNDGLDDLYIGGAKGRSGELLVQRKNGSFIKKNEVIFAKDMLSEDTDATFFDADMDGDLDLYVVSGGNDFKINDPLLKDRLYLNKGDGTLVKADDSLPDFYGSGACVTSADIDGDADLDLFVGSYIIPGRYPEIPKSQILINDGKGNFSLSTSHGELEQLGLITDAEFVDINGDNNSDLVIVGEWMPIKVFISQNNSLADKSSDYITFASSGWWNTIHNADMDDDGDEDLIIGNLGLNSQIKVSENQPASIYYDDYDMNGSVDPIMCYFIQGKSYPMPGRDDLLAQLPYLKKKFRTYHDYAVADIKGVLSESLLEEGKYHLAGCFETVYLQNDGDKLTKKDLPGEVQIAPVNSILSGDFDNDGNEDLLLTGNKLHTRVKFGPYDANHGQLLLGIGNGTFQMSRHLASGLIIKGSSRSSAYIESSKGKFVLFGINDDVLQSYRVNFSNQESLVE